MIYGEKKYFIELHLLDYKNVLLNSKTESDKPWDPGSLNPDLTNPNTPVINTPTSGTTTARQPPTVPGINND